MIEIQYPQFFPDGRTDARNASLYTGFAEVTLANWRSAGKGPKFIKRNHRVFYFKDDLDAWLTESGQCQSTAQARRALG